MPTGGLDLLFELSDLILGNEDGTIRKIGTYASFLFMDKTSIIKFANLTKVKEVIVNLGYIAQDLLSLGIPEMDEDSLLRNILFYDTDISLKEWFNIKRNPDVQH